MPYSVVLTSFDYFRWYYILRTNSIFVCFRIIGKNSSFSILVNPFLFINDSSEIDVFF